MPKEMSKAEAELFFKLDGEYDLRRLNSVHRDYLRAVHPDGATARGMSYDDANDLAMVVNGAFSILKKQFVGSGEGVTVVSSIPRYAEEETMGLPNSSEAAPSSATGPIRQHAEDSRPDDREECGAADECEESPACMGETPVDGVKRVAHRRSPADSLPLRSRIANVLERVVDLVPFSFIIVVLSWTLPFYFFGGLNIFPSWKGFYEASGVTFLIAYVIVPMVGAFCALHYQTVDWVIRAAIVGLVRCPVKTMKIAFEAIVRVIEDYAGDVVDARAESMPSKPSQAPRGGRTGAGKSAGRVPPQQRTRGGDK